MNTRHETGGKRRAVSVLLVDDTIADVRLIEALLERDPRVAYDVFHVDRLQPALSALASNDYDVILLDVVLPDSRGFDTALEVLHRAGTTPVVALLPSGHDDVAAKMLEFGIQEYLTEQDFSAPVLTRTIRYAIERRRLQTELDDHAVYLEHVTTRFHNLMTDNTDGVIVADKDGVVRYMNPAAEKLLSHASQSVIRDILGWPFEGSRMAEIRIADPDDNEVVAEVRVGLTIWDSEKAYIATIRDISDHKRIQEALIKAKHAAEQANRMKSDFLAGMSHELRTPLNSIIGFSEMMQLGLHGPVENAKYEDYLGSIHTSARHLLSLINDLLDLSKAESGKDELSEEQVNVGQLIADCATSEEPRAAVKRILIRTDLAASSVYVLADARKLKQILLNLISNAVKFTPEDGEVVIGARLTASGQLELSVADTGVGMSEDEIPKAFMAFAQLENPYVREEDKGTGLGLPLARRLAELHGGSMGLVSKPGVGTTATVTLPAERVLDVGSSNVSVLRSG